MYFEHHLVCNAIVPFRQYRHNVVDSRISNHEDTKRSSSIHWCLLDIVLFSWHRDDERRFDPWLIIKRVIILSSHPHHYDDDAIIRIMSFSTIFLSSSRIIQPHENNISLQSLRRLNCRPFWMHTIYSSVWRIFSWHFLECSCRQRCIITFSWSHRLRPVNVVAEACEIEAPNIKSTPSHGVLTKGNNSPIQRRVQLNLVVDGRPRNAFPKWISLMRRMRAG